MANAANHVSLSTGQILFADPTKPWVPANFPNLPSTSLALTAAGTIAGRDIEKLTFPNTITYQNYETPSLRPALTKSLVVDAQGYVAYDDPKVSLVSTSLSAYNASITQFGSASIGAPGITSSPPDTLTNAIAKLDGWITQNLLKQPPAVNLAEIENTSLYAGVRWYNYNVYNILENAVPFTTGIILLLGDPSSGDYLTLELTNPTWFPDRQYADGLASDFNPIVRLRIFNEFFLSKADELYSKAYMQTQCVKIIGEGGIYTLPSKGKVFAIENSVAGETYTTLSLYLPQIPVGASIPVRIIYINKTQTSPNVFLTYTSTVTYGAPSVVSSFTQVASTPTSFTMRVSPPIFSDETHNVSSPYFSSYNIEYSVQQMNTAHAGNLGFRYGQATPSVLPAYLSSYINSTFTRIAPVECGAQQDIKVAGSSIYAVLPGIQWSTSIYATNSAQLIGSTLASPVPVVSAFPSSITQNISSANIRITSPWSAPASSSNVSYIFYNNGWNIDGPLSTNTIFLASTMITDFEIDGNVQFNDPSYPGCRSNMTFTKIFRDTDNLSQTLHVTVAPSGDDFALNTSFGAMRNNGHISTIVSDPETAPPYQKFLYSATVTGAQAISTISTIPQSLTVSLTNFPITGFNTPIVPQTLSTPHYVFFTESGRSFNTSTVHYASTVTNLTRVSGIYTPTPNSQFYFDMYASNFVTNFANFSSIGMGQLYYNGNAVGPAEKYTSSLRIFNNSTELTSTPFPVNTTLRLSSCTVHLTSNIYQDPADPFEFELYASATPANPAAPRGFQAYYLGPELFADTESVSLYSSFTNINSSNGLRVLSLLPRYESPGTATNMNDGIDVNGLASNGLNTSVSSFLIMGLTNNLTVSTSIYYNHTSSLITNYLDPYSRELLFTNGQFTHPGGLNFGIFSGTPLGIPSFTYPNFTNDLATDVNYGNRYASFLFFTESNAAPTAYQFANIRVRNTSALSTITNSRSYNYAFPDQPIPGSNMEYSKVRMHMKIIGAYNAGVYTPLETNWINCLKQIDYINFDDSVFDVGGCITASTVGADVYYKVQIDRRFFTSVYALLRVGISADGSAEFLPPGSDYDPITFEGINVSMSDS